MQQPHTSEFKFLSFKKTLGLSFTDVYRCFTDGHIGRNFDRVNGGSVTLTFILQIQLYIIMPGFTGEKTV